MSDWRAVYAGFDDAALAAISSPGLVRRAVKLAAEAAWVGQLVRVQGVEVRLDGGGPAAGRCPCPVAGICVHLLSAAIFVRDGLPAPVDGAAPPTASSAPDAAPPTSAPTAAPTGPSAQTRALTAAVRQEVEQSIQAGLGHLSDQAADRLDELGVAARSGGLPLLARYLGAASAQVAGLVTGDDQISEAEVLVQLARAWGLAQALDQADPANWPRLCGVVRRQFATGAPVLDLRALGAIWSVHPSGARGLRLITWEAASQQLWIASTARPAGGDAGFYRTDQTRAFWNTSLSQLLAGPFRLTGPRLSADGRLSATAEAVAARPPDDLEEILSEVAGQLTGQPLSASFTDQDRSLAVLAVDGFGKVVIDEPSQEVVWSLSAQGQPWQLRQAITPASVHRLDALLAIEAGRPKLAYVLAERVIRHGRAVWEPVTLFIRQAGGLAMLALDFPPAPADTKTSLLQKRWAMLRRRLTTAALPGARPASALTITALAIQDLLVDLAASGRLACSPAQRHQFDQLAARCDDLALATLARLIRALVQRSDALALLRLQLVLDRVMTIAARATD